jgi:hypothetical protein
MIASCKLRPKVPLGALAANPAIQLRRARAERSHVDEGLVVALLLIWRLLPEAPQALFA